MSEEIIKRLETKVDRLIATVQTQNAILAEHSRGLESLGQNLTLLNEVQRSHGTQVEQLFREVRSARFTEEATKMTPIPVMDPELVGKGNK